MARQRLLKTPVLIIGGGPSGMVAALCLAKCGVKSIILERRDKPGRHPKAHEVSARTLEILTSLGIDFNELQHEASPHEDASRILFCRTLNEEIGRIDLNEKSVQHKYAAHTALPRPYLNLSQTEIEKILRRHVVKNKHVKLMSGVEWKSLSQNAAGVLSVARRIVHAELFQIQSDYVLCADGAGGRCRDFLGIKMVGPEKIQDFANAYFTDDLTARLSVRAKLFFIFKPDAVGTFIAHQASRRWVYHVPVMTPYEKIEDFTEDVFRERIAKAVGDPAFKANIASISSWRMTAQVAESFQSGRVFLVGDSAHRFPPTGGLGLNSGVADVHNLCWKLAAVIRGEASSTLAGTYEKERKGVIQINCDASRKNYFNLFKIPASMGLNPQLLSLAMRLLAALPFRWCGKKFRALCLRLLYQLADRRLLRYKSNPLMAARVRSVIADQLSHFDRIGLDLGYRYSESGASLQQNRPVENRATEYSPAFLAGARLPVFDLLNTRKKNISLQLLDYANFTLFTPAANNAEWKRAVSEIGMTQAIRIIPVPHTIMLAGSRLTFTIAAGISETGAILVRPDANIAAVFGSSHARAGRKLAAFFSKAGYSISEPGEIRRIAS